MAGYGFCVSLWHCIHSFILWVYFRNITIVGERNIPDKGAVIVVGNHSGGAVTHSHSPMLDTYDACLFDCSKTGF